MAPNTPVSRAIAAVTSSKKPSKCVNCNEKIPKTHILCTTCHQNEGPQTEAPSESLHDVIPRLYSHLCRAAAIMTAILPRQEEESNEKYIQRLLREAEQNEAAGTKKMFEAETIKAAKPIRKRKNVRAESISFQEHPEDVEDPGMSGGIWFPGYRLLLDPEGRPYVYSEMEDSEYSHHNGDDSEEDTLEDDCIEECPICRWRLIKDRCMRCGY